VTTSSRTCTACAAPIPAGALYCARCGADAPTEVGAETPPSGTDDAAAVEARKASLQAAVGSNFNIQRLVGRGGFGEVWAAFDIELQRAVAIKVLRTELVTTPGFRERFRHEARAVAKMRHPGIVPIYHVGEAAGLVYFIMPLVDGATLKSALDMHGRLDADETLRILVEASAALREAHRRGIVHRDLKPENVMLEGPERHVLLMDFGIAQSEDIQDKALTGADMVLGSPEYMSPEQATGKRKLDGRSDIYSLGVLAYRMLAGRLPFDADTARELLIKHVTTPPEPLEGVPPNLSHAIMRCLAKTPDERWQTTDEFVSALNGNTIMTAAVPVPADSRPLLSVRDLAGTGRSALGLALALAGLLVGVLTAREVVTTRSERRHLANAEGMVEIYRQSRDSLRELTAQFLADTLTAAQFLPVQEAVFERADRAIEQRYGPLEESRDRLPEPALRAVDAALDNFWLAGLHAVRLAPRPSESALCTLEPANQAVRLRDNDELANCWYGLAPAPAAVALPVEYFLNCRMADASARGAGLGFAWCAGAATCRVAFLWQRGRFEWGSLRAGSNLQSLQLGRVLPDLEGTHQLRMRFQNDRLHVWLDSVLVLERRAPEDAAFFERPGDLRLVVQNAAIEVSGTDGVGLVGGRRP